MSLVPDINSSNAQRLERSRRNLVLAATFLAFIQTTGAKLSGVAFQGATLTFSREDLVILWLWTLMIYFWIRYFQHFVDFAPSPLTSLYWGLVHKDASTIAAKKAVLVIKAQYPEYSCMDIEPALSLRQIQDPVSGLVMPWALVKNGFQFDVIRINLKERQGEIQIIDVRDNPLVISVPNRKMLRSKLIHAINLGFSRTVFTEYIFPMLLPFLPIAIQIYNYIYG